MYTGLITCDGLVTQCMQWGFNIVPAHFQEVTNHALDGPCIDTTGKHVLPDQHPTYLDDVYMGADNVEECWHNTEIIIVCLALCNLPIGIWKCTQLLNKLLKQCKSI